MLGDAIGFRGDEREAYGAARTCVRLGTREKRGCDARAACVRGDEEIFEHPHRALCERRVRGKKMCERNRSRVDARDVENGCSREALGDERRRSFHIDRRFVETQIVAKERDDRGEIVRPGALDRQATNFGRVARMRSIAVAMASSEFAYEKRR